MPGDGTKLDTTTNKTPPPARLLDITRLISRVGRRATGVDRVELAYLRQLLAEPAPFFAVSRTKLGFVLLDHKGAAAITARIEGAVPWGAADALSHLARSKSKPVRQAESDLRRHALARCLPRRVSPMLARHVPKGFAYLNTGHSNLTRTMMAAVRRAGCGQISVLIHDTIPLDFPQYQRPGTPERFQTLLTVVQENADLVIYNSHDTQDRCEFHMRSHGELPRGVVALLGVDLTIPDETGLVSGLGRAGEYFVTVGTIEPRKGHDVLLDVWQAMMDDGPASAVPGLLICGARGWNNQAVFERLDALPPDGPIHELAGLSDAEIAGLLLGSKGLLFPSRAEGFGLPPVEAAALGVPVACLDLPVYRETLGDIPVYAEETDCYHWRNIVEKMTKGKIGEARGGLLANYRAPTWDEHFNIVLRFT